MAVIKVIVARTFGFGKEVKVALGRIGPEFISFTYDDPTRPKAGLRRLEKGDLLIFYCGLEGWDFKSDPALYLMGYFEVLIAGRAGEFGPDEIKSLFGQNFHIRHPASYE